MRGGVCPRNYDQARHRGTVDPGDKEGKPDTSMGGSMGRADAMIGPQKRKRQKTYYTSISFSLCRFFISIRILVTLPT